MIKLKGLCAVCGKESNVKQTLQTKTENDEGFAIDLIMECGHRFVYWVEKIQAPSQNSTETET